MRLIVFFDLPVDTPKRRHDYRVFRRFLVKNGYLMMQKSVYSKLAVDGKMCASLIAQIAKNKPPEGFVQVLKVTEKQFGNIVNIVGDEVENDVEDSLETLVVL